MNLTPRSDYLEPTKPDQTSGQVRASYPPSVLIFCDNATEAQKLKLQLEQRGCQVVQADPKRNTFALLNQESVEMVVLNLNKGDEEGLEQLFEQLKTDPELSSLPLAVISSRRQFEQTRPHLPKCAFLHYLPKDNSANERLLQVIKQNHYLSRRYM